MQNPAIYITAILPTPLLLPLRSHWHNWWLKPMLTCQSCLSYFQLCKPFGFSKLKPGWMLLVLPSQMAKSIFTYLGKLLQDMMVSFMTLSQHTPLPRPRTSAIRTQQLIVKPKFFLIFWLCVKSNSLHLSLYVIQHQNQLWVPYVKLY